VPISVRMDSFGAERRGCCLRPRGVPPKQVPDTKAGHRLAAVVAKHRTAFGRRSSCTVQKGLDRLSRLRPQRTQSFLASLGEHDQLQLMPPGRVKRSGLRIHITRCSGGSTSSSRTATAGEAIAFISTTTPADCGRFRPVGPTLSPRIRLWLWQEGDPRSVWPICSCSPI
jgi:hypothetical protein